MRGLRSIGLLSKGSVVVSTNCVNGATRALGKRVEEPTSTRTEMTQTWFEDGEVLTDVVKGSFAGVALEELTKMV